MLKTCEICGGPYNVRPSHAAHRRSCSKKCFGEIQRAKWLKNHPQKTQEARQRMRDRIITKATRKKLSEKLSGRTISKHWREKLSRALVGKKRPDLAGPNNVAWKGGPDNPSLLFKKSLEFKAWRTDVFTRDGFKCRKCGGGSGFILNAHHIKNFAQWPEYRIMVSNGITLCLRDHRLFHRTYGIKDNSPQQIRQFLKLSVLV